MKCEFCIEFIQKTEGGHGYCKLTNEPRHASDACNPQEMMGLVKHGE